MVPTHIQGEVYTVDEISDMARYILYGTSTEVRSRALWTTAVTLVLLTSAPTFPPVKIEPVTFLIDAWAQALAKAMLPQGGSPPRQFPGAPHHENSNMCNFCGAPDHYIRECGVVQEYIDTRKIRHDAEGKVILSSGAFIPRSIPGKWLHKQVDEWHWQNPGQLTRGQLLAATTYDVRHTPTAGENPFTVRT